MRNKFLAKKKVTEPFDSRIPDKMGWKKLFYKPLPEESKEEKKLIFPKL